VCQGKELSYNNILDADAAFECVAEFDVRNTKAVVIVKHQTPCGVAACNTFIESYARARACDPEAAYGGVIALNGVLDMPLAKMIAQSFVELIICPAVTDEALHVLRSKLALRILITGGMPDRANTEVSVRSVAGGFVIQSHDSCVLCRTARVVTKRPPTTAETKDLLFAFTVAKHAKSNAIVYAADGATLGIGSGHVSRFDAARFGALKVGISENAGTLKLTSLVAASDAFFPFPDALQAAIDAGVRAVIQPGGAKRDEEVIALADSAGVAMVFADCRHFRH
jgi:phosphoribosylaminoimidazolecarboxamide formyltransferase/IMP cyclohydrolase